MNYTKPKLIQLIHIAKNQLAIDEVSYRALLFRLTGKQSCKAMKIAELQSVLHEMEQKGFKTTAGKWSTTRSKSPSTQQAKVKHPITHKIRAVWINMAKSGFLRDGSEEALNHFVRHTINPILSQHGLLILNVQSLDYQYGSIVLERLKKWQSRCQQAQSQEVKR